MDRMAVVAGDHEAGCHGCPVFLLASSHGKVDPAENIVKEGGACALLRAAAHFLVVHYAENGNALLALAL